MTSRIKSNTKLALNSPLHYDLINSSHIIKSHLCLKHRVSRTVHQRQNTLFPLRLLLILLNPPFHLPLIAPVTDRPIPFPDLMQLTPTRLRVQRQGHEILNRTRHAAQQDFLAQIRFRGQWSSDADSVTGRRLESACHTRCGAEAARDVDFCLFQVRPDGFCEFDKVGFSSFLFGTSE